ncbi:hypothetical protein [Paraburkholderia humisilvae]|uniref:Uncharacterized protein n=1 Tax=Paraburkholderia humisilvae TaxID=627669 RepID=A0A6J5FCT1_9BURK|nr:hypothetical protein [Paraburkholderia humisilvae]CAB3775035.1 hypothetical protein LMG29542_08417 [Paraburkholderia humisilvae]
MKEAIDIVGWFVTSLMIGAGAPAAGMWLTSVLNTATEKLSKPTEFVINYFVPYRDGQLGYVVLGWAMGAIVELMKSYFTAPKGNEIASGGGMVVLALIGTALSAIGASNPAKPKPADETAWRHYTLFRR